MKNTGAAFASALPALTLLCYLLLSEPPSVLLLFLSALTLHEWGHLCAFYLLDIGAPSFRLSGVGARLTPAHPIFPWQEALIALSGPLVNLLFALFALRYGRGDFFFFFAVVHLLFALGNLLPFGGCDGERILRIFLVRFFPRCGTRLLAFLSLLFMSFFLVFFLFLYYLTGNGLSGVFFSLFFLFEGQKTHPNVF